MLLQVGGAQTRHHLRPPEGQIDIDQLVEFGLVIVRNAFDPDLLFCEYRRQSANVERWRSLHKTYSPQANNRRAMISVFDAGTEFRIDGTSVVSPGSEIEYRLSAAAFDLLTQTKAGLSDLHYRQSSGEADGETTSSFANFYACQRAGVLVDDHVDRSFLTALTAAVNLLDPGMPPLAGFEYLAGDHDRFTSMIPQQPNDLIVMFGREAEHFCKNGRPLKSIRHRVVDTDGVANQNRFTMVFKIHCASPATAREEH